MLGGGRKSEKKQFKKLLETRLSFFLPRDADASSVDDWLCELNQALDLAHTCGTSKALPLSVMERARARKQICEMLENDEAHDIRKQKAYIVELLKHQGLEDEYLVGLLS